jgi:hypothetical protein
MKNDERENYERSNKRPNIESTSYPEDEKLSILSMGKDFEQSSKKRTEATIKGSSDYRKYVPRQECDVEKYTHRVLIGNSSGTHRRTHIGLSKKTEHFSLCLNESEVKQMVEDYYHEDLMEFLDRAIVKNLKVLESGGLDHGEYRSPCWQLVSELRGHHLFKGITANDAVHTLDMLINWDDLPDCDIFGVEADPIDELIDAWNYQENHQIKPLYPTINPITVQEYAKKYPLSNSSERPNFCNAISILYWYAQLMNQDGWFFLSAGKLAELINVSKRSAAIYIRRAINDGQIKKHKEYPKEIRQATEYKWIGVTECLDR